MDIFDSFFQRDTTFVCSNGFFVHEALSQKPKMSDFALEEQILSCKCRLYGQGIQPYCLQSTSIRSPYFVDVLKLLLYLTFLFVRV